LHGTKLRQVAFFCTQGGSGSPKVFRDMADLCGRSPLATMAVNVRELEKRAYAPHLERFATAIMTALNRTNAANPRNSARQAVNL
jgi:hypothetical protein